MLMGINMMVNGCKDLSMGKVCKIKSLGILTYTNGDKYTGDWRNNKRHGYGTSHLIIGVFTYYNGDTYEGEWSNDRKEGKGNIITNL